MLNEVLLDVNRPTAELGSMPESSVPSSPASATPSAALASIIDVRSGFGDVQGTPQPLQGQTLSFPADDSLGSGMRKLLRSCWTRAPFQPCSVLCQAVEVLFV